MKVYTLENQLYWDSFNLRRKLEDLEISFAKITVYQNENLLMVDRTNKEHKTYLHLSDRFEKAKKQFDKLQKKYDVVVLLVKDQSAWS